MNHPLPTLAVALLLAGSAFGFEFKVQPPPNPSEDEVLRAIAIKETGDVPTKVGRLGERSAWQIRPDVWHKFSHLPHKAASTNADEAVRVARAYLALIRQRLRARHLPETAFFIAACWNAGPYWRSIPVAAYDYAQCVENLANSGHPTAHPTTRSAAEAMFSLSFDPPPASPAPRFLIAAQ